MFSSTNNLHLFPLPPQYFPSSSSSSSYLVPPPPLPLPNPTDIFIHQDPLPFLGTTTPLQVTEESAVMKNEQQQDHGVNMSQNGQCYSGFNGFLTKKAAAKKDRHSKIYTAQGLRDRRVRLSIEISRKFFDLQDMLGYDKASKTLDWLLTKSRKAIKELTTKSKNGSSKNLYLDSECEVISSETNDDDAEKMLGKSPSPSKKNIASFHDVMVKESRAKARARARERTKEKIMSKSQAATAIPEILNQLRPPPPQSSSCSSSHLQLESCTSSAIPIMQKAIGGVNSLDQSQAMKENNIIGIMWKPSGGTVGNSYPKNSVVISKADAAAAYYNNCNNFYFPTNLPQNWDINVDAFARAQSGFCSIANMDSFSEFQVCGRPWEACNNNNNNSNQHLH